MGGAFENYGNVTLSAEFNIWVDPDAVDIALAIGVPITFVPLDVTEQVSLL
jgi:purine nucleosidase